MELTKGDLVKSRVDTQGLTRGRVYEVVDVRQRHTFAGTFTTVDLEDEDRNVVKNVGNVHLVLDLVCEAELVARMSDNDPPELS